MNEKSPLEASPLNRESISRTSSVLVLNDQGGDAMNISYDVVGTLRSQMNHHEPIVLVYDARGNGGGDRVSPTITGDHQDRITDYTAIVVKYEETVQQSQE